VLLGEPTGQLADAWHHPQQIRKAVYVLAVPQCPTEIEQEVRSSWQDLSLGTNEQQGGFPAMWSEKFHEGYEGWLQDIWA
jgi:hypothetical protein